MSDRFLVFMGQRAMWWVAECIPIRLVRFAIWPSLVKNVFGASNSSTTNGLTRIRTIPFVDSESHTSSWPRSIRRSPKHPFPHVLTSKYTQGQNAAICFVFTASSAFGRSRKVVARHPIRLSIQMSRPSRHVGLLRSANGRDRLPPSVVSVPHPLPPWHTRAHCRQPRLGGLVVGKAERLKRFPWSRLSSPEACDACVTGAEWVQVGCSLPGRGACGVDRRVRCERQVGCRAGVDEQHA